MLQNWMNFEVAVLIWFGVFIAYHKINTSYYIRKVLKLSQTKSYKLLDCFPCQSFWVGLIVTFNPLTAIIIYFMANATKNR